MSNYTITLTSSEIVLLKRALKIYSRFYQDLSVKSKPKWEKEELREMSNAGDQLCKRFMRDNQWIDNDTVKITQDVHLPNKE